MAKLGTQEFKKVLTEDLKKICADKRYDFNIDAQRGFAFQQWCAQTYLNYDQEMDTAVEDALLGSNDLGADLIFEDSTRKYLMIGQCKYVSLSSPRDAKESEINDFFARHDRFMDRAWVRKHGSERAVELLIDYSERISDGWRVSFCFFTTGPASDRIKELVDNINVNYSSKSDLIDCALYDFAALKDFYVRSLSLEESIPDEVTLQLPRGRWIIKDDPHKTLVTIVKGNALRDLYGRHKEALFAFNIRGYLGDRGINSDIRNTAEAHSSSFYYFNNGVSAICTDFEIDAATSIIKATKFQVINGAQTIGALRQAKPSNDVEVLLRITKTLNVATEKGFNSEIIKFNNSQNVVKVSDFRSNDPIQQWLEKQFVDYKSDFKNVLPEMVYARKRGFKKRGRYSGIGIKLEDVAKIRFAFNFEPTRVLESPKDMWTSKSDGGVYELAFGINGELADCWTDADFEELLFAIAVFRYVEAETKSEASGSDLKSFGRLKYHALGLAGIYFRGLGNSIDPRVLLGSAEKFEGFCEGFWPDARRVLIDGYLDASERLKITISAMARNSDLWEQSVKKFSLYKKIRRPDTGATGKHARLQQ
jgi:AIPR protein